MGFFWSIPDVQPRYINTDDATTTAIATGWSIVRSAGSNYWRHMVCWHGTWWYLHSWLDCCTDMWCRLHIDTGRSTDVCHLYERCFRYATRDVRGNRGRTQIHAGYSQQF